MDCFISDASDTLRRLTPVTKEAFPEWLAAQNSATQAWIESTGVTATPGTAVPLPGPNGRADQALLILEDENDHWSWGAASARLPAGHYQIYPAPKDEDTAFRACLGWALGDYVFDRYKKRSSAHRQLLWPENANQEMVLAVASGVYLTRDLINTPAADMGPGELASAANALARDFGGACETVVGDDLLRENFPMIHAVGRASSRPPRLIDLTWGDAAHPKLTLVGKGVCFDTGGLDLKPSGAMLTMKKDMGGAAQVLGLARMIMATKVPVKLRVLIPAVENSVSGDSFRPLDVLSSRKGLTVEVGNTDAEGRLVLGDALTLACEEAPDMLIDFATLTGAARVAVGTDLPALFCNSDQLAGGLHDGAEKAKDPIWRMPLHKPYASMLDSKVADTNNISSGGYAGAITAALFLEKFITPETDWAHFDLMSWNTSTKPGRPEGGEAQSIRGVFEAIRARFS